LITSKRAVQVFLLHSIEGKIAEHVWDLNRNSLRGREKKKRRLKEVISAGRPCMVAFEFLRSTSRTTEYYWDRAGGGRGASSKNLRKKGGGNKLKKERSKEKNKTY